MYKLKKKTQCRKYYIITNNTCVFTLRVMAPLGGIALAFVIILALGLHEPETFFGPLGWEREPMTNVLGVPGEIIGGTFPEKNPAMSLFAQMADGSLIGERNFNTWDTFLCELPRNLGKIAGSTHEGTRTFHRLLSKVWEMELEFQGSLSNQVGGMGKIAHGCGVMVLKPYEGAGVAKALTEAGLALLRKKGFKAVVFETTNPRSAALAKGAGAVFKGSIGYRAFGIPLDGEYSIWVLML